MEKETASFIAELLTNELKEETKNYQPIYSCWVEKLIKATKDFYEYNAFYTEDLERLIKDYYDTKEWVDSKTNKGE